MKQLNTKQLNNLLTGNSLAVEIKSSSNNLRAFVVISAYVIDGNGRNTGISKCLNCVDKNKALFWLRKYEISKEYINNDWDVTKDELKNSIFLNRIKSIHELENELSKYLDDFSELDVTWNRDNPL